MTAPTHTSFGILSLLGVGLLIGKPATPETVALATLGALLPDIDTDRSALGRVLFPLSRWLERRLGHRGATHSLLAAALVGVGTMPLLFGKGLLWLALLVGYLSHILIDAVNKSGVPLFYPSPVRAVMPKAQKWRIATGSRAEGVLFVIFSLALLLLWPVNRAGLFPSLHALLSDTHSAIGDYRTWENQYQVIATVDGVLNISQQPIAGVFFVLGVENANSLVVYDEKSDLLFTVGTDFGANIFPKRIRCRKGEPIVVETRKVQLQNELLGNLMGYLPQEGQTFIKGRLKTQDRVLLPQDPDTYQPIKPGINQIDLRYARRTDLQPIAVRSLFVISGDFYLRTIHSSEDVVSPATPRPVEAKPKPRKGKLHVTEMYIHQIQSQQEIQVTEGQEVVVGDLIAERVDPDESKRLKQEERLKTQLAAINARASPFSALFRDEIHRQIETLQTQREKNRIYSSVNGRVLWIRTHAIADNNTTVAIKLLVREP